MEKVTVHVWKVEKQWILWLAGYGTFRANADAKGSRRSLDRALEKAERVWLLPPYRLIRYTGEARMSEVAMSIAGLQREVDQNGDL